MPADEAKQRRNILRLILAGAMAICLPAYLGSNDYAESRRQLMAEELVAEELIAEELIAEKLDEQDYAELRIPEALLDETSLSLMSDDEIDALLTSIGKSFSKSVKYQSSFKPYTIADLVEASHEFSNTYSVMIYDPEEDLFELFFNEGRHRCKSGCAKMTKSYRDLSYMLRQLFPERFCGKECDEFAIAISSGDYPHMSGDCYKSFPHTDDKCTGHDAPILNFGSSIRHADIFPNMISMPMPSVHLKAFKEWTFSKSVLGDLRADGHEEYNGKLVFGEEFGLEYDELIPQVVWRGTDFGYLNHIYTPRSMRQPVFDTDIGSKIDMKQDDIDQKKIAATRAMEEAYDTFPPRWQGVIWTAKAEREAEQSGGIPWSNIKFTTGSQNGIIQKHSTAHDEFYLKFEEHGIPAIGESMSLKDLAKFKYQIDIGGGGGTTWTGTTEKLAMPGLLFHHVTPTKDYIHDRLMPWCDYVPVAPDLSDLKEKYDWAESHPRAAKLIARHGSELMRRLGTPEGFGEMYNEELVEPMRKLFEAYQPVSRTHPGSSWRDALQDAQGERDRFNECMRCTGNTPQQSHCTRP